MDQRIQIFDSDGNFLNLWQRFKSPAGITVDMANNVYFIDRGRSLIYRFDIKGNYLAHWGIDQSDGDGQFYEPSDIETDRWGNVFVVDSGNNRIQNSLPPIFC